MADVVNEIDFYHFIDKEFFDNFYEVERYLKSRIWPHAYPNLEKAFINFANVIADLRKIYYIWLKEDHTRYYIERFYKQSDRNNAEEFNKSFKEWQFHSDLVGDLGLELTRSANYICDEIRKSVYRKYRIDEGAILTDTDRFIKIQYNLSNDQTLYPGLCEFMKVREGRDLNFGEGIHPNY